ncbi:MAG TPA: hypothetical protein PLU87_09825 [Sedimentisphaerales bacterium]|nr:hypothetical protein [Sedimentisphaerales bacterium]HRS11472.1 hypothetical protein [Sedimentisphaerales bacterium]HRV47990.1 hypothetical protein [Sedimentisphaerales bacterium]
MSRRTVFQILLTAMGMVLILVFSGVVSAQGNSEQAFERVKEVQERHTDRLMAMAGVEGTAVGYDANGQVAVHVYTEGPGVAGIPRTLDGVPVHVEVTGKFYAQPKGAKPGKKPTPADRIDPTGWFERPVPIGVSTGNEGECSAGTIGCRVTDGTNVYALSNNHVYALENKAATGSEVLQPGLYDTGCVYNSDNVIGRLTRFEEIVFSTTARNTVDAAIALCSEGTLGNATPSNGYGTPGTTPTAASVGMAVQKYGRTTGLTKGTVTATNATVNVGYSSGTARFVGQIVITGDRGKFSNAGDSGSLIVTNDDACNPVGLLFAGSVRQTIANPIDAVLDALDVEIDGK